MRRSLRLVRLLILAGVALWLGSPPSLVRAQVQKSHPAAKARENAPAEDKGPPRISVLRLQVVKPAPPLGPPDAAAAFARRNRFGFEAAPRDGTSLTFMLDEPQQSILSVEAKDCKIVKFGDDKGTDLAPDPNDPVGRDVRMLPVGVEEGPVSVEVDPTGHRATVTVHSPRLPAGGANRLLLEAVLAVRYARGEKIFEHKNVTLKLDKLTAGPYSLIVASQDNSNNRFNQGGGTQVILFHQGPLRDIKKVAFIGEDGQEIAASASGSGQTGSIYSTHYSLSKEVETCTIRLTAPETIETVNIAVGINTGIGFPPFVSRHVVPAPETRPNANGAASR
jgi:hypothetical protein